MGDAFLRLSGWPKALAQSRAQPPGDSAEVVQELLATHLVAVRQLRGRRGSFLRRAGEGCFQRAAGRAARTGRPPVPVISPAARSARRGGPGRWCAYLAVRIPPAARLGCTLG